MIMDIRVTIFIGTVILFSGICGVLYGVKPSWLESPWVGIAVAVVSLQIVSALLT